MENQLADLKTDRYWVNNEIHNFLHLNDIQFGEYTLLIACAGNYIVSWYLVLCESSNF